MSRSRSSRSSSKSKKSNRRSQSAPKQRRRSRSRQQQKEEKGQNNCLYIGNLDKRCPEDKLKEICQEYGPFQYCYIVFEPTSHNDRNRDTKISRGYGFVKYEKQADAIKAKQALTGRQIMTRKVTVEVSKRTRPRQSTPGQYLGRRRSPPRRQRQYRRRSYSRSSSGGYRRRRKHSSEKEKKNRDHKQKDSKRRDRDRSRSGQKKHKKRRQQSRSNSPRK